MKTLLSLAAFCLLAAIFFYSCKIPCYDCPTFDGADYVSYCQEDFESEKLFDAFIEIYQSRYNVSCTIR